MAVASVNEPPLAPVTSPTPLEAVEVAFCTGELAARLALSAAEVPALFFGLGMFEMRWKNSKNGSTKSRV